MSKNDEKTCGDCGGAGDECYGESALNPDGFMRPCSGCGGSGKR